MGLVSSLLRESALNHLEANVSNLIIKGAVVALYLLSIVAGVFAIDTFGIVSIPGGFMAPAAVYVIGVTLVLRDIVHEAVGRRGALLAIVAGAGLSAIFSPALALASGLAFLISETLDMLVYEQVRDRFSSRVAGMTVSNVVSIPVDSVIFLFLAFGSLDFFWGQVVGKGISSVLAIVVLTVLGTTLAMRRTAKIEKAAIAAAETERVRRASLTGEQRFSEDFAKRVIAARQA